MPAESKTVAAPERTLVVTRFFDAPRELVFKAWTDPEQLAQWFPPKDFTAPVLEADPRPGGVFRDNPPPPILMTVLFEDEGTTTKLTVHQTAETVEDHEALERLGSREGLSQSFEKLDALLARNKGEVR